MRIGLDSFNSPAMAGKIRIGTSGYSFADWVGVFYPETIAKGKMLDFYAEHFDTVEINSTYYRIPHPKVLENMVKKTSADFEFMVKTHSSATHQRKDLQSETPKYLEAIKPIADSFKLKGILAQFPWSFKRSPENQDYLKKCREALAGYPLFVEFRHNSWTKQEIFDLLKSLDIGYVCVDEPQLSGMVDSVAVATTGTGYVRLHGRNADKWWNGGPLRYDYLYSDAELSEWSGKIRKLAENTEKVYVFFNNCHEGQAVTNARRILEMLDVA